MKRLVVILSAVCTCFTSFASGQTSHGASTTQASTAPKSAASTRPAKTAPAPATPKTKFQPYEVIDQQQGNLVVSRLAVPEGWKTMSKVTWNYRDFYWPVYVQARTQSPDNSSWIEFFPAEFFVWLDPMHERAPIGPGSIGGIHDPNVSLQGALVKYVIAPNRRDAKNLKIVGSRAVSNLPAQFSKLLNGQNPPGEAVCMRVQYELDGATVEEEFYAFMTRTDVIPSGNMVEYHKRMILAHSMGAKSGKLESIRPLLGFVATSIEPNPAWGQRVMQVQQMQSDYYERAMAANYAGIRAAGERSRALAAQDDQFLKQIDANMAAQNAAQQRQSSTFSANSNEEFYKRADDFDQNIRGTEHMQDQYGQVSDQYTDYNYHWTDGFGRYVHTDDPNYDPNKYLNGNYQQMTPAPR
jgi:hypothetical protein